MQQLDSTRRRLRVHVMLYSAQIARKQGEYCPGNEFPRLLQEQVAKYNMDNWHLLKSLVIKSYTPGGHRDVERLTDCEHVVLFVGIRE